MKKILLCTDGSNYAQISYQYVGWLAQQMETTVEVLYVTDSREQKSDIATNLSGSIGIDAYQQLLDKLVVLEREKAKINHEKAKVILEAAKESLQQQGVTNIHLTHRTGFLLDCFHEFEEDADLIVLGKRGESAAFAPEHLGTNIERLVRSSHKPCLVTSRSFDNIERLLLAYDGSKSSNKALEALLKLPAFAKCQLHIIHVAKHGREKGEKLLQEVEEKAREAGFSPICQILEGATEEEIAQYIEENQIHLLIMGAYGHRRIRYLVIGSNTAQMLRICKIPILLWK